MTETTKPTHAQISERIDMKDNWKRRAVAYETAILETLEVKRDR